MYTPSGLARQNKHAPARGSLLLCDTVLKGSALWKLDSFLGRGVAKSVESEPNLKSLTVVTLLDKLTVVTVVEELTAVTLLDKHPRCT